MAAVRALNWKVALLVGSEEDMQLLVDVIDMHLEGMKDAEVKTVQDPTIESAGQLLDLMSGYTRDSAVLTAIKERVENASNLTILPG